MTTINWGELTHAYGSAEDIPGLFAQLGGPEDDRVWTDLWSALCHQGSVYEASWAAMPVLADIALGRAPGEPIQAVLMAGLITTDPDPGRRERYAPEIAELLGVARALLATPGTGDFVYLQMAVLAFEDAGVWAEALEGVVNEEYELECPECEDGLFVAFGSYGYFCVAGDYVTGPGAQDTEGRAELAPIAPDRLDGIGARLHREAVAAGQHEVAHALTYVFGTAHCPSCDAGFTVSEEVERQWV
ncbi:hypothetical protein [Streptomyces griseorubiginosus]|uniref:hypothetical protein n=1 Tax=Streptomyces griseorubiginosus TaxID=67304 RepID=UPI001AD7AE47|nr:hypothetical protein [Streptomyces griseorubiginosus]MBO4252812.1 hypothetical protein [Streptomyces griseorubiginosus]